MYLPKIRVSCELGQNTFNCLDDRAGKGHTGR